MESICDLIVSFCCVHSDRIGVRLLVDAEYTYMNPGISVAALCMMLALNRDGQAVVANTYQCYLKDALNTLKQEAQIVTDNGCMFGAFLDNLHCSPTPQCYR